MEGPKINKTERYKLRGFTPPLQVLMMDFELFKEEPTEERKKNIKDMLEELDLVCRKIPIEHINNPRAQNLLGDIKKHVAEVVAEGSKIITEKGEGDIKKAIVILRKIADAYHECKRIL